MGGISGRYGSDTTRNGRDPVFTCTFSSTRGAPAIPITEALGWEEFWPVAHHQNWGFDMQNVYHHPSSGDRTSLQCQFWRHSAYRFLFMVSWLVLARWSFYKECRDIKIPDGLINWLMKINVHKGFGCLHILSYRIMDGCRHLYTASRELGQKYKDSLWDR